MRNSWAHRSEQISAWVVRVIVSPESLVAPKSRLKGGRIDGGQPAVDLDRLLGGPQRLLPAPQVRQVDGEVVEDAGGVRPKGERNIAALHEVV